MNYRYHGSLATSRTILLRELGIHDQGLQRAAKAASEAEEMSNWKEKAPVCVQIMDICLMFKIGDIANNIVIGQTALHTHCIIILHIENFFSVGPQSALQQYCRY